MKDGTGAGEPAEATRRDVYEDYVKCFVQLCTEVQPCRDARLLKKAARYLLRDPEPGGTFTVFPFYEAVTEGCESPNLDCRKHLSAFVKATELLETLCVNLFLQPWKKEIRTLKTFTGPFVYCLLPVLSSSTIQSVLASIGYLPHTDAPQSEFRLSDDANSDKAMLVGFELLLARVECYNLLELLDKNQLGPQEWLEVLQRRVRPTKLMEHLEKKTTMEQKEEEEEEEEEEKKKKTEESDKKEGQMYLDTRPAANPRSKPRRSHFAGVDQSIMEMQRTYPDLAFRGRPLLPDKPHKAHGSTSGRKSVRTAELHNRDSVKGSYTAAAAAAAAAVLSRNDDDIGDEGGSGDCNDGASGGSAAPGDTVSGNFNTDGGKCDDALSGPQAISLHLTLRTGPKEEQSLKPGELQPTEEPRPWTQQRAGRQSKRLGKPEYLSLSSVDEERELRQLAERMGQRSEQENKDKARRKEDNKRGEGKKRNEEKRVEIQYRGGGRGAGGGGRSSSEPRGPWRSKILSARSNSDERAEAPLGADRQHSRPSELSRRWQHGSEGRRRA